MPKILKPYTIIPPDLYVQRDADRQVKYIINDMGRPGYVLVSRQMGKTNLLINAKRRLETPDDVFVYVDLSSPFDNAKCCFENIIDTALETNPERFVDIANIIKKRRAELGDIPPHKQHINELRLLLNATNGKLVIILDEIDALTKTPYSDHIFAQIRSIYFARVNFKELERLTYLLSGVIEPNDIIKDPKISPFNIGQKIFLNDFSKEEFEQFLSNSKLALDKPIRDRIYFWVSGNPRMTWDVCAEVENYLMDSVLTTEIVDKIVKEIYLTSFDKPPVDNIRELIKNDRFLRNAVIDIVSKNKTEISDKIKSKLYLAGIINYNDNDIHIKNEVIRQSLNLEWLKYLEEEDRGLVNLALEYFNKENYAEALNSFERFLTVSKFNEDEKSLFFYYMGYAAYKTSDFKKSIQYLDNSKFDVKDHALFYFTILNLKGLSYYYENDFEKSLSCFKIIIDSERKDEFFASALLSYGSISLKSNNINYRDDAISIFDGIINETELNTGNLEVDFVNELKSIAHYNLAQFKVSMEDFTNAKYNYKQAIKLGKYNTIPTFIVALYEISNSPEDKYQLLQQLIKLIIDQHLVPIKYDPDKPLEFCYDDLKYVLFTTFVNYRESLFNELRSYLSLLSEQSVARHFYDLALYSVSNQADWDTSNKLLIEIYNNFDNFDFAVDEETKYRTLKLLAYFTNTHDSINYHLEYITIFVKKRFYKIDYFDLAIFANLIFALSERHKYTEALSYVNLINSIKQLVPQDIIINYLLIYHLELNIFNSLGSRKLATLKAQELIKACQDKQITEHTNNLLGESELKSIKENAENIIKNINNMQKSIKSTKKYERNETVKVLYMEGKILEIKYKKIETELNNGVCEIIA